MTSELENISYNLRLLKCHINELSDSLEQDDFTTKWGKAKASQMSQVLITTHTHLLCYIETMKNHRRERRQQYRKNKKAKKTESVLTTELYKIKI
jgi:hypothetical protein